MPSKLDYRVEVSVLEQKMKQAGGDAWLLLQWVASQAASVGKGEQVQLLGQVWGENFQMDDAGHAQQTLSQPAGAVQNPHDPEAQWACKGVGKNRKEHVGWWMARMSQPNAWRRWGTSSANSSVRLSRRPARQGAFALRVADGR